MLYIVGKHLIRLMNFKSRSSIPVILICIASLLASCKTPVVKNGDGKFDGIDFLNGFTVRSRDLLGDQKFFALDTKVRPMLGSLSEYSFSFRLDGSFSKTQGDDITIARWDYQTSKEYKKFPSVLSIYYSGGKLYGMVKIAAKRKHVKKPLKIIFFKSKIETGKWYNISISAIWEDVRNEGEVKVLLHDLSNTGYWSKPLAEGKYKGKIGTKSEYGPKFKVGIWDKSDRRNLYSASFKDIKY